MKLKYYIEMFFTMAKLNVSRQMIYSINFWMEIMIDVVVFLIQLVTFETIYAQVDTIDGWNRYHMIFFLGTFMLIDAISMTSYYMGLGGIPYKIRGGLLDMYIVRPINTLFFLSFEEVNMGSLFLGIPSLYMIFYSSKHLAIELTVMKLLGYIFLVLLMSLLLYDVVLIFRTFSFLIISTESLESFQTELENFSFRIPGVALKGAWKVIFCVIIPMGLIATVPTQFFTQELGIRSWIFVLSICFIFTVISQMFWKFGMKHYTSVSG